MPNSGKLGSLDAWREEQGLIEQATGGGALPAGGEATPTGEPVAVLAMDDADALPATGGALLQAGQHAPVAVSTAFRSGGRAMPIPEMSRGALPEHTAVAKTLRVPVPAKGRSLTWRPGGGDAIAHDDDEDEAGDAVPDASCSSSAPHTSVRPGHEADSQPAPPSRRSLGTGSDVGVRADGSRFHSDFGPPPPPLNCAARVFEGADDYPEADWGAGYLVDVKGSSAWAKFGGGGSVDVPAISSSTVVQSASGRAYWEVRIDKRNGLLRFGLGHFHEAAPGDPGLAMGNNWTGREGDRCTWYLSSDQGDVFEGRQCLVEGPPSHALLPGDVVSVELIDGMASFAVNYQPFATAIQVKNFPVQFCVLFCVRNDRVSLVRDEYMPPEQHAMWMESRSERGEKWRATIHKRIAKDQEQKSTEQEKLELERTSMNAQRILSNQDKLESERQRVENMIAAADREREERKRKERQERGEPESNGAGGFGKVVTSLQFVKVDSDEELQRSPREEGGEVERLRRERDAAKEELERARLEIEQMKARESASRETSHATDGEGGEEGDPAAQDHVVPDGGEDECAVVLEGLALDDDEYEGGDNEYIDSIPEVAAPDDVQAQEDDYAVAENAVAALEEDDEYSHYADADADPKAIRDPYQGHEHADGFECGQDPDADGQEDDYEEYEDFCDIPAA